jgi:hypothetical protein
MKRQSPLKADFDVGDRVRLIADTLAWRAEKNLQNKPGEVVECRDDGRISVRFDGGRRIGVIGIVVGRTIIGWR